ncbi:MAG: SDR family oxidoreductase [Phycisphaerae bacterium]|nr:SDR family oxidoreductase [Phycisphaerae bacterium]
MDLTDKVAVVTGAARRVGRAIAIELAEAGCHVVVHCRRSEAEAEEVAALIRGLGREATVVAADLADPHAPSRIVEHTIAEHGQLDVLVNNAAAFPATPLEAITQAAFAEVVQTNLIAPVLLAAAAWPHFQRAGAGKIVNILDISAERPWPSYIAYCAAKAGLRNATLSLARVMAPAVQVNGVAPGVAEFPEERSASDRERILAKVPLGRAGSPADIAKAVRFLVADADYVTGQVITVDGGRSIAW